MFFNILKLFFQRGDFAFKREILYCYLSQPGIKLAIFRLECSNNCLWVYLKWLCLNFWFHGIPLPVPNVELTGSPPNGGESSPQSGRG